MDKKGKKLKSALKNKDADSSSRITDPRFASFETDPRFKLPSKKHTKTTIDKRFSRMLKDDEFLNATKVDRYGRKLKSDSKKKALQRLYQEEDEDDEDEDEDDEDDEDDEVDDDEIVQRELRKAETSRQKHDPARRGGFSESESDSDSDSDSEDGGVDLPAAGDMQRFQDQQAEVESGEVTRRVAIVNLDWDHIKSTDLMALFSSFVTPESGQIEKISVYPSEFGKERMQQEEIEGPPKALFRDAADEDDDSESEDDEKIKKRLLKEGDDEDFDSDALRKYQLDRLRYYYAVMICSNPSIAKKIYDATDGTEFQSSSNFLDLRFVPDDVTFDDEPRDECTRVPDSYKPVEFVTNALQSSKVKLTWDMHPEEASRKDAVKRAFSGSRAELEENDLRAYLASDTEDEADDGSEEDEEQAEEGQPKLSKKELARKKMREALGLSDEPTKSSKHGPVGGMEITFTPALSETKPKKKDPEEETTLDKYVRKERERKEMKRQKAKARREGRDEEESESDAAVEEEPEAAGQADAEDLGFDDPFFTMEDPSAKTSKSSIRKEERRKKREAKEAAEAASAAEKAKLAKVMAEDANENQAEHLDHFDMNDIIKAEKHKRKKGKGKVRALKQAEAAAAAGKLQQDFSMDVQDERFKAVFDSHEFAIDPSNPKFKGTEGMKQLLEEGRKKRRGVGGDGEDRKSKKSRR